MCPRGLPGPPVAMFDVILAREIARSYRDVKLKPLAFFSVGGGAQFQNDIS